MFDIIPVVNLKQVVHKKLCHIKFKSYIVSNLKISINLGLGSILSLMLLDRKENQFYFL